MSFVFEDRKSNYPYRYKVTPLSGESYYVYLERADEPTVVGTPLNADTFNTILKEFNMAGVLPKVSEEDNGKLMVVSGGAWASGGVIAFAGEETLDDTTMQQTNTRATCVVFTEGDDYILHSVKVVTTEESSVKFVLFEIGENELTQITVLGETTASGGFAELTIDGGYFIPKNTVIVAISSADNIEAYSVDSGINFSDVNLYGSQNITIPYTEGVANLAKMAITFTSPTSIPINDFTREVSLAMQLLDRTISEKVDSYVAEALGGDY